MTSDTKSWRQTPTTDFMFPFCQTNDVQHKPWHQTPTTDFNALVQPTDIVPVFGQSQYVFLIVYYLIWRVTDVSTQISCPMTESFPQWFKKLVVVNCHDWSVSDKRKHTVATKSVYDIGHWMLYVGEKKTYTSN